VPRTLQNFLGHLGQPRVAAGPHTPPLYRCVSSVHICWLAGPVRTSQWAISGPTHSAARGACAQVRSPRASTLPPPFIFRARARTPQPHTLTVTRPTGGAALARPRWPLRPYSTHTSPACPPGTQRPSIEHQAGLCGRFPAPQRRQRQVRVHNCQARPQPPPTRWVPSST
jgi:hypothetical protein